MSTDSGVSDLIRQFQTRRLQTDPEDTFLFQPAADPQPLYGAQPPYGAQSPYVGREVPPPKRRPSLALAPPGSVRRASHVPAPGYPDAPRDIVWPWVAAIILAGILGVVGAAYLWPSLADDRASPVAPPVAAPESESTSPVTPPVAAPESHSAPALSAPADALAVDATVPPISSSSAAPAASSPPHKKAHRTGRARAKAKRIHAKHVKP